ncbi:CoA pyrophosphatase [Breoghania sp.]|uniref:CoA pyrophosphatase n=1 Tax=Breoghania sp. TaxID=2065378 RepID=UPI002AA7A64B|nr:CoA pyrophosphatase [Breoghania sp.]
MKLDALDTAKLDEAPFSAGAFRDRVLTRLNAGLPTGGTGCLSQGACLREAGDHVLNPSIFPDPSGVKLRDAAVLIPVVDRGPQASVILTRRTDHLASHAGQIAFPGGKIDEGDRDATHAALREAEEEIGLGSEFVDPIGNLGPYLTGSGYRITPVLAYVREGFSLRPEPGEVADIFEVPLEFLMSPGNHLKLSRQWKGARRHFYAMPYERHYIWGVTAGILRSLYDTIYA